MSARATIGVGAAVVLLLTAVACGDDPPAPAPAAKPKPAAKPAASPQAAAAAPDAGTAAAAAAPEYRYEYNPLTKRDPFRTFYEDAKGEERPELCNEPLCTWDLDQLSLVAVVSGDANPIAMVEDATRTGHMVRRSTKMGKQGGQVTQILRDCIVVTEYWLGADNKRTPHPVKMCIKQEQAKTPITDLMNPNKRYE